jgi:hypothetical protein
MGASQKIPSTLSPSAHFPVPINTLGKGSSSSRASTIEITRAVVAFVSNVSGWALGSLEIVSLNAITLSPSAHLRVTNKTFVKGSSSSCASTVEITRAVVAFVLNLSGCTHDYCECFPESPHFELKRLFALLQYFI